MIIVDKIKYYSKGVRTEDNRFIKEEKPLVNIDVSHLRIPMEFADCIKGKVKNLRFDNIDDTGGFLLIEGRKI